MTTAHRRARRERDPAAQRGRVGARRGRDRPAPASWCSPPATGTPCARSSGVADVVARPRPRRAHATRCASAAPARWPAPPGYSPTSRGAPRLVVGDPFSRYIQTLLPLARADRGRRRRRRHGHLGVRRLRRRRHAAGALAPAAAPARGARRAGPPAAVARRQPARGRRCSAACATGIEPIVYSNTTAGGYGERMLLSAPMISEVPNGLDFRHAALTEPMAVGLHAVNKSRHHAGRGRARARLRARSASPSSPRSSSRASTRSWPRTSPPPAGPSPPRWAPRRWSTRQRARLRRVEPGRQEQAARGLRGHRHPGDHRLGPQGRAARHPARRGRRVHGGTTASTPSSGSARRSTSSSASATTRWSSPRTLQAIAEGEIDVAPLITGEVDLDGVAGAFEALGNPDDHCKILVTP